MRTRILAASLVTGVLVGTVVGGCWVNRKTSDFACTRDEDCEQFDNPERHCDEDLGYCVRGGGGNDDDCPDACADSCNPQQRSCTINCPTATSCDNVDCPEGWDCTITCGPNGCDDVTCHADSNCDITCSGNSACGNISCDRGECEVTCTGPNACDNVECGEGRCEATCTGSGACDVVNCSDSCQCDISCPGGGCETASCPVSECEQNGGCSSEADGCPEPSC